VLTRVTRARLHIILPVKVSTLRASTSAPYFRASTNEKLALRSSGLGYFSWVRHTAYEVQACRLKVQTVEVASVIQGQFGSCDELWVAIEFAEHFDREVQRLQDDLLGAGHHLRKLEVAAQDEVLDGDRQELLEEIPS
jgi:hypothetical protein